jgi:hypothetical protein
VDAAFDRADGDRVGDKKGLKAGLDDKQPAKLAKSRHKLTQRQANGGVPPFPV